MLGEFYKTWHHVLQQWNLQGCNIACWWLVCYGLPACTLSRRACLYCMIALLFEVIILMFWWLSYYCSKDMLSEFAYMLAGRNTSHGVKFCESLPTAHVLTRCDCTSSLYRIGKCVTNTNLQDLVENGNQSFTTFGIQENVDLDGFFLYAHLSSACMK